jgi:hypothetical protein
MENQVRETVANDFPMVYNSLNYLPPNAGEDLYDGTSSSCDEQLSDPFEDALVDQSSPTGLSVRLTSTCYLIFC